MAAWGGSPRPGAGGAPIDVSTGAPKPAAMGRPRCPEVDLGAFVGIPEDDERCRLDMASGAVGAPQGPGCLANSSDREWAACSAACAASLRAKGSSMRGAKAPSGHHRSAAGDSRPRRLSPVQLLDVRAKRGGGFDEPGERARCFQPATSRRSHVDVDEVGGERRCSPRVAGLVPSVRPPAVRSSQSDTTGHRQGWSRTGLGVRPASAAEVRIPIR